MEGDYIMGYGLKTSDSAQYIINYVKFNKQINKHK